MIHVTGDNRYQLFVNGELAALGPARGDLFHWRYETVDIAPNLKAGRNALAAVVWNDGPYAAVAQISNGTGFLVQGDTDAEQVVNTGSEWRCIVDKAYTPNPIPNDQKTGYQALGPAEQVDAAQYPWGWERTDFDDSHWPQAVAGTRGEPRGSQDASNRWFLVPRSIPFEERRPEQPMRGSREMERAPDSGQHLGEIHPGPRLSHDGISATIGKQAGAARELESSTPKGSAAGQTGKRRPRRRGGQAVSRLRGCLHGGRRRAGLPSLVLAYVSLRADHYTDGSTSLSRFRSAASSLVIHLNARLS